MVTATVIAIDGPVASGKTAVGRLLGQKLGYRFLDTGIMYRALAWIALERGMNPKDSAGMVKLAHERSTKVVFQQNGDVTVLVNQTDVTPYLWYQDIEDRVSLVAQVAGVREVLVEQQRSIGQGGLVVMVGRDIGTVVLPDAQLKVFLAASIAERARRRHAEFQALGRDLSYQRVLYDLEERDRLDSERKIAPLRPASDARIVLTDDRSVEGVVDLIMKLLGHD